MNDDFLKSPALPDKGISAQQTADERKLPVIIFSKEKDTRLLFQTFLQMSDYHVEGVNSFEQLLSLVQMQHPKIILMDSIFPFDENLDFIRRLKSEAGAARTPVIMISGFSQVRFRQLALSAGADEYLVKPVNFDALENSIKKFITAESGNF